MVSHIQLLADISDVVRLDVSRPEGDGGLGKLWRLLKLNRREKVNPDMREEIIPETFEEVIEQPYIVEDRIYEDMKVWYTKVHFT